MIDAIFLPQADERECDEETLLAALADGDNRAAGELLEGSHWTREGSMDDVVRRARELESDRPSDPRLADFVQLAAPSCPTRGASP